MVVFHVHQPPYLCILRSSLHHIDSWSCPEFMHEFKKALIFGFSLKGSGMLLNGIHDNWYKPPQKNSNNISFGF